MSNIPTSPFTPKASNNQSQSKQSFFADNKHIRYQPINQGIWVKIDHNKQNSPSKNPNPNYNNQQNPTQLVRSRSGLNHHSTRLNSSYNQLYNNFKIRESATNLINRYGKPFPDANNSKTNQLPKPIDKSRITSYLFHNFPEHWCSTDLWDVFKKYGNIHEVYIPRKTLKNGRKFGFVRFLDVPDYHKDSLARRLSLIVAGDNLLKVYKARDPEGKKQAPQPNNAKSGSRNNVKVAFNSPVDERNFKEVVLNKQATNYGIPSIKVNSNDDLIQILGQAVIAKVKDLEFLEYFNEICESENLGGFTIKYLGGHDLMLIFEEPNPALDLINNSEHPLWKWLEDINPWDPEIYKTSGRLVYVNIFGVPITCWLESTFIDIAKNWGEVIETFNCSITNENNQDLSHGSVIIKTNNFSPINGQVIINPGDVNQSKAYIIEVQNFSMFNTYGDIDNSSNWDDEILSDDHISDEESHLDCENRVEGNAEKTTRNNNHDPTPPHQTSSNSSKRMDTRPFNNNADNQSLQSPSISKPINHFDTTNPHTHNPSNPETVLNNTSSTKETSPSNETDPIEPPPIPDFNTARPYNTTSYQPKPKTIPLESTVITQPITTNTPPSPPREDTLAIPQPNTVINGPSNHVNDTPVTPSHISGKSNMDSSPQHILTNDLCSPIVTQEHAYSVPETLPHHTTNDTPCTTPLNPQSNSPLNFMPAPNATQQTNSDPFNLEPLLYTGKEISKKRKISSTIAKPIIKSKNTSQNPDFKRPRSNMLYIKHLARSGQKLRISQLAKRCKSSSNGGGSTSYFSKGSHMDMVHNKKTKKTGSTSSKSLDTFEFGKSIGIRRNNP
ncbi:uncharacterized protein [Rutidosis leptorrhynchoides]|uniref:uncharacterized protein n=1 Tax=Rutidosis leptorrhynchoides TaxID=125765 RepID=UPI003A998212